jgi:large conductance mechanosensitive channel
MIVRFLEEFKKFAMRGNVIDLAVGIIIGAAFGRIVNSLVEDIVMPPIGLLIGGVDFSDLELVLKSAKDGNPPVVLKWGQFLNQVVNFAIISFSVFVVIKVFNTLKKEEKKEPVEKTCLFCFMSIPKKAKKCPYCLEHQEEKQQNTPVRKREKKSPI